MQTKTIKQADMPDIKELVKRLGGPVRIANHVGITHSAVCQWKKIPSDYVMALYELSIEWNHEIGDPLIQPEEMRPDLTWKKARPKQAFELPDFLTPDPNEGAVPEG